MININARLYPVSKEAGRWRDMDAKDKRAELLFRIALVTGILFFTAIAIALSCYFGIAFSGADRFSFIPVTMFTGVFAVGLAILLKQSNFEKSAKGKVENFSNANVHNAVVHFLTTKKMEDVYARYYRGDIHSRANGGLGGLVRKGYILSEQGDKLRVLLKEYAEKQPIAWGYTSETHTWRAIQANHYPAAYAKVRQRLEELDAAWLEIRQEIRNQYWGDRVWEDLHQPTLPTDPSPQILPIPRLMRPTRAAVHWRNLDATTRYKERAFRIGMIAAIIILLTAAAISNYFSFKTPVLPHHYLFISACSGAISLTSALALSGMTLIGWNFAKSSNAGIKPDAPYIRDNNVLLLTEGNLDEVHDSYYKQHRRIEPLVQNGYLTIEQGKQMSQLFKRYDEISRAHAVYMATPDLFTQDVQDHPENYPAYNALVIRKTKIENQWRSLQESIKENYRPGLSSLPNEVVQNIFSFLLVKDLENVERVNHFFKAHALQVMERRCREYHLENDKPKKRLQEHFDHIMALAKNDFLPKQCIVRSKKYFRHVIDGEATLRKLQLLEKEDAEELRWNLGHALSEAISQDKIGMVKSLLTLGANLEVRNEYGCTPLVKACSLGNQKIVELLLKKGADTNALDAEGKTPLHLAILSRWDLKILRLLLEHGASKAIHRPIQGESLLHIAAKKNDKERCLLLLKYGALNGVLNTSNLTPAQCAPSVELNHLIAQFNSIHDETGEI